MNGSSFGAVLRMNASRAATSGLRGSSSVAMYSAGVETLSWPFMAAESEIDPQRTLDSLTRLPA